MHSKQSHLLRTYFCALIPNPQTIFSNFCIVSFSFKYIFITSFRCERDYTNSCLLLFIVHILHSYFFSFLFTKKKSFFYKRKKSLHHNACNKKRRRCAATIFFWFSYSSFLRVANDINVMYLSSCLHVLLDAFAYFGMEWKVI